MKLRLNKNSIRFRLTKSEVKRITDGEHITEVTQFSAEPVQQLTFTLRSESTVQQPVCQFQHSILSITLPALMAKQWAETEQVGIYAEQQLGDTEVLKIIIEKDFKCINPDGEENPLDKFDNPRESK